MKKKASINTTPVCQIRMQAISDANEHFIRQMEISYPGHPHRRK